METPSSTRPAPITAICLLGFFGVLITLPLIFTLEAAELGAWFIPYFALTVLVGAVSLVGLWQMKRWGFFLYAAMAFINQIVLTMEGRWGMANVVMPGMVILIVAHYYPKLM